MKSLRILVPSFIALAVAVMISGCGKSASPTSVTPGLDPAPPAAPAELAMQSDPSTGAPWLEWSASTSPGVAGYQVFFYAPNPDRDNAYMLVSETDASTTRYPLPSVSTTTTMFYRVKAFTGNGTHSIYSPVATITLNPTPTEGGATPPPPGRPRGE